MERIAIEHLRALYGDRFFGPDELKPLLRRLGADDTDIPVPEMNYAEEVLAQHAQDYLLVMGVPQVGQTPVTIRTLREVFGVDPEVSEPCFYNQDWYLHEDFIDRQLEARWYLLRKEVVEDTRAVMPERLMARPIAFPSAILCAYTFFACQLLTGNFLWYHDFVWCSDTDHNGDRIYLGKYHDVDGVNKNGFSVHRHLALRPCYAALDTL